MQVLKALRFECVRLPGRIAMKYNGARHIALFKPNSDTILDINGRKQDHGAHCRKLAISANPSRWLFSGWNWVPAKVSRPTIAVIGPP